LYLGGRKSYNFLHGPANFRQGKQSAFDMTKFNLPLPDERTCRRLTAFTNRPGIIVELLLCIIHLLKSRSITPLVDNNICTVFGMCISRDGIGLKPELNFDPIRKILVGAKFDIDIDYIKNHPNPDIKTLKDAMIQDADTLVLTDLENLVSLPVGLDYSKHSQTGEEVKTLLEKRIEEVQICTGCIEQSKLTGQVIADANVCCIRRCEMCCHLGEVCDQCKREGQISIYPQLRACQRCIVNNVKCSRLAIMAVIHDCEQKNKTAMEKIVEAKMNNCLHPEMSLTNVGPDAVHIGKCLTGSLSNWWLLVDDFRIHLVILRILRQMDSQIGKLLRDSVQRKDRQSTESIAEISSEEVLSALIDHKKDPVVCTIVPEKFRKCDDNHSNILKEPIDICLSEDPSVLYVADRMGFNYSIRLHYPAEVKLMVKGLFSPVGVVDMFGVLVVCESGKHRIVYVDHKKKLKIDISKGTKKCLCELAAFLNINEPEKCNLKTLRQNIQRRIELKGLSNNSNDFIRVLKVDAEKYQPAAIVKVNSDLLFVADLQTKLPVAVERKITARGYELFGTLLCSISIPEMSGCFGLTYRMNSLIISDHSAGILRIQLNSNHVSVILATDTENCTRPHGIAIIF